METRRLVLDTQVWIDWLVFDDPSVAPIRDAVAAGRAPVVIDRECEAELARALGYRLGRRTVDAGACLRRALQICKQAQPALQNVRPAALPKCRDPDDQKFLELAAAAGADCLITRDRALLALAKRGLAFRILSPQAFAEER
jgi:putative PIN family toxin of toxin-antitoxin system